MNGKFERVSQDMFWAVPLRERDARNKAIDHNLSVHALITAYIADTAAKDERISRLEEYANEKDTSVTKEMHRANEAEARITELEAQDIIVAAPDLYAALKSWYDGFNSTDDDFITPKMIRDTETALKKARGEA